RSPVYTLFPYTTLFRSKSGSTPVSDVGFGVSPKRSSQGREPETGSPTPRRAWSPDDEALMKPADPPSHPGPAGSPTEISLAPLTDRKSTRLNSSHLVIS